MQLQLLLVLPALVSAAPSRPYNALYPDVCAGLNPPRPYAGCRDGFGLLPNAPLRPSGTTRGSTYAEFIFNCENQDVETLNGAWMFSLNSVPHGKKDKAVCCKSQWETQGSDCIEVKKDWPLNFVEYDGSATTLEGKKLP